MAKYDAVILGSGGEPLFCPFILQLYKLYNDLLQLTIQHQIYMNMCSSRTFNRQ